MAEKEKTVNAIKDLGTLTKIPVKSLNNLFAKLAMVIGSEIHDAKINEDQNLQLNIGIGILSVDLVSMQCKFIPSAQLKTIIKAGSKDNIDPLEYELEEAFIKKMVDICDEIF